MKKRLDGWGLKMTAKAAKAKVAAVLVDYRDFLIVVGAVLFSAFVAWRVSLPMLQQVNEQLICHKDLELVGMPVVNWNTMVFSDAQHASPNLWEHNSFGVLLADKDVGLLTVKNPRLPGGQCLLADYPERVAVGTDNRYTSLLIFVAPTISKNSLRFGGTIRFSAYPFKPRPGYILELKKGVGAAIHVTYHKPDGTRWTEKIFPSDLPQPM